jgi:hypothetical protein
MKDLPETHPIRRIWADERKSKEDLAEEGDRDAIRDLLAAFRSQWHRDENHPLKERRIVGKGEIVLPTTLYRFFDRCAERILAGEEPNAVFGWRKGNSGRPKRTANEEWAHYLLAYKVHHLLPTEPKRADIKRAVLTVMEETGETESKIREATPDTSLGPTTVGKPPRFYGRKIRLTAVTD